MTTPIWLRNTGHMLNRNSPTILSGVAVAGVITTAVLAAKAGVKAYKHEVHTYLEEPGRENLTKSEIVKLTWKDYIPAGISGVATIACIIGANKIGLRRHAAMMGAFTIADTAFREYKEEVLKQIGAVKEGKVSDEVQKRRIDENQPPKDHQVIIAAGGDQLCYDSLTGRYFKSDIETIRQAKNQVNSEIIGGNMYASLNEFYAFLGLDTADVGEELGFNLDNLIELTFTTHMSQDGRPCLAMVFAKLPVTNYGKVF